MTADLATAFQAGIAGTPDDVPDAMTETHDALIDQWGKRRRSGIKWQIYGSELAFMVAQARGRPLGGGPAGTMEEGWERLTELLDVGEASAPDDYLTNMKRWAANFKAPTLVIAFCEIRQPREVAW